MSAQFVADMTLMDAFSAVCLYLNRQESVFTAQAYQIAATHYRVKVRQQQPDECQRLFDVALTDVPDCWDVTEVEAA
jgi:hypothetical protein